MSDSNPFFPGMLSQEDTQRLLEDRSPKTQMEVAEKLATHYVAEGERALNAEQVAIANDIFKLLLNQGEAIVKAMLAMILSQTNKLPPELAKRMAEDSSMEVAGPVLQYSPALSDADLHQIIRSFSRDEKLKAIAGRETVSEAISEALAGTHIDSVVSTLMRNAGAAISDNTYATIAAHHADNAEVVDSLLTRASVPLTIVDKVIQCLSVTLRQDLERKYGSLSGIRNLNRIVDQSLELTSLKLMGLQSSDQNLMRLLQQLDEHNRLSPFSALCMADLTLFEISLSRLLRVPVANVHILVQDNAGFKVLYDRAGLPPLLFDATALALRAIRELASEKPAVPAGKDAPDIKKVTDRMQEIADGRPVEGLKELLAMMQHQP